MHSNIKNWASKSEFWLAIIAGLSLSIGIAPVAYVIYFQRVGWVPATMTHTGPLWATSFGYQLCYTNIVLLFAFPIITIFLTANYRKTKLNNISRLGFVLSFVQFIWGLINMVLLFWLIG